MISERERVVRLKLNRGRTHIDEVLKQIQAFWKATPPRLEWRDEPTLQQRHWVVRLAANPPLEEWALSIGDALHNLRAALDHLVWQLVEANGHTAGRNNAFPIADDDSKYRSIIGQSLSGVGPSAVKAIEALKPWKGGNDPLWLLHQLDIQDKHRLPLVALASHEAVSLDFGKMMGAMFPHLGELPSMRIGIRPADRDIADGTVLYSEKIDDPATSKGEPQFQFEIDLKLPDGTRRPLGELLLQLSGASDAVIGALSAHLA
jgi:hypothetical protein